MYRGDGIRRHRVCPQVAQLPTEVRETTVSLQAFPDEFERRNADLTLIMLYSRIS
jgi:hypothetical protein